MAKLETLTPLGSSKNSSSKNNETLKSLGSSKNPSPTPPLSNVQYNSTNLWKYEDTRAFTIQGIGKHTAERYSKYTQLLKQIERDHPIMCFQMPAYKSIIDSINGIINIMLADIENYLAQ